MVTWFSGKRKKRFLDSSVLLYFLYDELKGSTIVEGEEWV